MFPVVAPLGTGATIEVALQLEGVAVVPLNLTVLVPCVAPKFVPVIVTEVPTTPDVGATVLIFGAATTVKLLPFDAVPLTVTTIFPVVAPVGTVATIEVELQLVAVAVVPLNFTVLVPCVVPNPEPVIVTEAPTAPEVGDTVVMLGAANTAPQKHRHKLRRMRMRRIVRAKGTSHAFMIWLHQLLGTQHLLLLRWLLGY